MIGRRIQVHNASDPGEQGDVVFSNQFAAMMGIEIGEETGPDESFDSWSNALFDRRDKRRDPCPSLHEKLRDSHILVVDDNPREVETLMKQLLPMGVRTVAGTNTKKALQALESTCAVGDPFGMVILNMQMSEMEEAELCDRIKTDEQLRDIPVVMLTPDGLTLR